MSSRQFNVNQALRKETLLICFQAALNNNDALTQRTEIGKGLRLATIGNVDGLEVLYHALREKYEVEPVIKEKIIAPKLATTTTDGQFVCPSCHIDFKTKRRISGHGPKRCFAKNNQPK